MEKTKEAWLICATHMGDYDLDTLWYVLHGDFMEELKQRVQTLRPGAVSTACDLADEAYEFGLVSSIYPCLDGFITPADCDDLASLFPEEDVYAPEPVPVGGRLEEVLGVTQRDVWRFSGGVSMLYVRGLSPPRARLDVTSRCGTMFRIRLPDEWFDDPGKA